MCGTSLATRPRSWTADKTIHDERIDGGFLSCGLSECPASVLLRAAQAPAVSAERAPARSPAPVSLMVSHASWANPPARLRSRGGGVDGRRSGQVRARRSARHIAGGRSDACARTSGSDGRPGVGHASVPGCRSTVAGAVAAAPPCGGEAAIAPATVADPARPRCPRGPRSDPGQRSSYRRPPRWVRRWPRRRRRRRSTGAPSRDHGAVRQARCAVRTTWRRVGGPMSICLTRTHPRSVPCARQKIIFGQGAAAEGGWWLSPAAGSAMLSRPPRAGSPRYRSWTL